jgi:iron complex outermembrane recepter protein
MTRRTSLRVGLFIATALASFAQPVTTEPVERAGPVQIEESRLRSLSADTSGLELTLSPSRESVPDVAERLPNFFVADAGARGFTNTVAVRGLVNTPLFGDPSVSVYLDDLPLGSAFTFPSQLVGFSSAELHRGLGQGTRFGRSGPAGVLQFQISPAGDELGDLEALIGSYQTRAVSARSHTRAAGGADVFAGVAYQAREGFIENRTLRSDVDARESTRALARVSTRPTQHSEIAFLVTAQRARDGAQALVPLGGPLFEVSRTGEGMTHQQSFGGALRASIDSEPGRFDVITGYSDWKMDPSSNVLSLGFAELKNVSALRQRGWTEEIKFTSSKTAALPLTVGVYGADERTTGRFVRSIFGQTFEASDFRIQRRTLAAFGEIGWRLSDAWRLSAGARAEGNRKHLRRAEQIPAPGVYERTVRSSTVSPKVSAVYSIDGDTQLELTAASSYKPGGFSAFTGNRALSAFGPERSRGLEAGLSRHSAQHRYQTAVRLFAYRIDGYQIERSFETGAAADDYLVVNADEATSFGAEWELAWKPCQGVTLQGSLGYTRTVLEKFRDPFSLRSYDGNRAPYVPELDASLRIEYKHTTGVYGALQFSRTGRTYYTEAESTTFSQSSYSLLGGELGWSSRAVLVAFYVENALDREYFASITPGVSHGTPGAPRVWGVRAKLVF